MSTNRMIAMTPDKGALVVNSIPFVQEIARIVASTLPPSTDINDLVQDGVIGAMDAAEAFDPTRGVKFETFAERRIRGAMIDALRKESWPRGVRSQRRELETAREEFRRDEGHEPSLADLASMLHTNEKVLGRRVLRISRIESTSPIANKDSVDSAILAGFVPIEAESPEAACERSERYGKLLTALASLPEREQSVISLYYWGELTMGELGAEISVCESRVSQLHSRAIRRLRQALAITLAPELTMTFDIKKLVRFQKAKHNVVAFKRRRPIKGALKIRMSLADKPQPSRRREKRWQRHARVSHASRH